jgi:hypothetical protein
MLAVSTKWCHRCGSEFVARVESCPDCGIELSADPSGPESTSATRADHEVVPPEPPLGADDHLVYELHEWSAEAREQVGRLMQGWAHSWQGTDLLVPAVDMEHADAVLDEVEATVVLGLDPDAEKLAYDLSDLEEHQVFSISASLADELIAHRFEGDTGELMVHDVDEEKVEAILDAVDFPDALPVDEADDEDDVDPLAASRAMSDLFVAVDRLQRNARDADGVVGVVAAAESVAALSTPYGFADADWTAVVERAGAMVELLDADDTEDETVEEAAGLLRTLLRQYV